MPEPIVNAVKLLWLSLGISAVIFVWSMTYGFSFGALVRFAIVAGLWAFAITQIPARNNLARLGLLALTAYNAIMYLKVLLYVFSYLFSLPGLLSAASIAAAIAGCYLLVKDPADEWFGPLTDFSLTRG
jgi:hypothetical protein